MPKCEQCRERDATLRVYDLRSHAAQKLCFHCHAARALVWLATLDDLQLMAVRRTAEAVHAQMTGGTRRFGGPEGGVTLRPV